MINLYISYSLDPQLRNLNTEFTWGNCLFGSAKLTKNADLDKHKYILLHNFHLQIEAWEKNVIIFGADMTSPVHVDNKGNDILFLGEGPTEELDDTKLIVETKYDINFTQSGKRFVTSLHYNGSNSFLLVNTTKLYQFKGKPQK